MEYQIDLEREAEAANVLSMILLAKPITGFMRYVSRLVTGHVEAGSYLFLGFFLFCAICFLLKHFYSRITQKFIVFEAAYLCFIGLNYWLYSNSRVTFTKYSNDFITIAAEGVVGAVLLSELQQVDILLHCMRKYLRPLAVLLPVIYLMGAGNYYGAMQWGNRMYPVALFYLLVISRIGGTKLDKLLAGISIVFSVLGGRQSMIFLLSGGIFIFLMAMRDVSQVKKFLFTVFVVLVFAVLWFESNAIIQAIANLLTRFNISSRSLEKLVSDELFDASNRMGIYNASIRIISENGNTVHGMFADQYYIGLVRTVSGATYAHNFALELLIDYGILGGSIIIGYAVFLTIKRYLGTEAENKTFFVVITIIGIAKCLVSSSVFLEEGTLFFIGLLMNKKYL